MNKNLGHFLDFAEWNGTSGISDWVRKSGINRFFRHEFAQSVVRFAHPVLPHLKSAQKSGRKSDSPPIRP